MKQTLTLLALVALLNIPAPLSATPPDSTMRRLFIGTSAFVLGNLFPDPPQFAQLNVGYWLTDRDVISVELITWSYGQPLGIPFGSSYGAEEENYPGRIREVGIGLAYQRHLWKGVYVAAHATNMAQAYLDESGKKIQNGYQLFLTYRLGKHITFWGDRFFIEPGIAVTHWPVTTNTPASFEAQNRKWPNYFLFEPGFHIGYKF
jgi:hypothetical protein